MAYVHLAAPAQEDFGALGRRCMAQPETPSAALSPVPLSSVGAVEATPARPHMLPSGQDEQHLGSKDYTEGQRLGRQLQCPVCALCRPGWAPRSSSSFTCLFPHTDTLLERAVYPRGAANSRAVPPPGAATPFPAPLLGSPAPLVLSCSLRSGAAASFVYEMQYQ